MVVIEQTPGFYPTRLGRIERLAADATESEPCSFARCRVLHVPILLFKRPSRGEPPFGGSKLRKLGFLELSASVLLVPLLHFPQSLPHVLNWNLRTLRDAAEHAFVLRHP